MIAPIQFPVVLSILFLIASPSLSQTLSETSDESADPRLTLSAGAIDMGEVDAYNAEEMTVSLSNDSDGVLRIDSVMSLCACVTARAEVTTLAPGDTTDLVITPYLEDYPKNEIYGVIRLMTDDPTTLYSDITIKGRVKPEYIITPSALDFGRVKRGQSPSQGLVVCQAGPHPLEILGVDAPDELDVAFKRITAPDDDDDGKPREYQLGVLKATCDGEDGLPFRPG